MTQCNLNVSRTVRFYQAAILGFLLGISQVHAKELQIIYTNDLHAQFEPTEDGVGGFARVKGTIDKIRSDAESRGVDVLQLDGGDFSDGTIYRYSDEGVAPFWMMEAMGYDATVVGNHDWLSGFRELNRLIVLSGTQLPLLSANLEAAKDSNGIDVKIKSHVSLQKAGARVAVLGLSTNEILYEWIAQEGKITSPLKTAEKMVPELKKNHDFVFILSHVGIRKDLKLPKRANGIDLIFSSHDHHELSNPIFIKDNQRDGNKIPLIEAGAHGKTVASLVVDLEPGKPLKFISYRLIPVEVNSPENEKIKALVQQARQSLESTYRKEWLSEVVAYSKTGVVRPDTGPTEFADLYAETLRDVAKAEMSLDIGAFYGAEYGPGPVTREMLYNYYPRTFDVRKPLGWTIWSVKAPGWLIQLVLDIGLKYTYINTAGVSYKVEKSKKGKNKISQIKINGKRLNPGKIYQVGVSEGIGRGADEISVLLRKLFAPVDTGVSIWSAVEHRLREKGVTRLPASIH